MVVDYHELLRSVRRGRFQGAALLGVTDRSFDVEPGFLFVARHGQRVDGSSFAQEAVARGAIAVVAEQPLDLSVPVAVVDDAAAALGQLSAAFFGDPAKSLQLVGITGTNGKTTTTALLAAALARRSGRVGTIGTLGVQFGAELVRPLALTTPPAPDLQSALADLLARGARDVVLEVSSHALRQQRTAGCRFAAAVFTNWTRDHTDYHGDMRRYLEAKGLLFSGLSQQEDAAVAILNRDSPAFPYLAGITRVPIRTFGRTGDVAVRRVEERGLLGSRAEISIDGEIWDLELRLPGGYNVENALAAVAAATALGVPAADALDGIASVAAVDGRMHVLEDPGLPCRVVIDYAHNPAGLVQLLRVARSATSGRLIAIFGGRGERDRGKRPLMGAIAAALADRLIVTVDNPRSEDPLQTAEEVAAGARESGIPTEIELDRYEAIRKALSGAEPGDTITISGKGAERWDELHDGRPMTDLEAAQELARQRIG